MSRQAAPTPSIISSIILSHTHIHTWITSGLLDHRRLPRPRRPRLLRPLLPCRPQKSHIPLARNTRLPTVPGLAGGGRRGGGDFKFRGPDEHGLGGRDGADVDGPAVDGGVGGVGGRKGCVDLNERRGIVVMG